MKNTETLSLQGMHHAAKARVHTVARELTLGFEMLEKIPRSVTFFGSSFFKEDNLYYKSAQELAQKVVKELGYSVTSGGGPGIMEAANRGAKEAGGHSVGMTIRLPQGQVTNEYITDQVDFYYFFVRKVCLTFSAEAFVFYPGGFGTLDEFFEVATLLQTKKVENVPVFLIGSDFWKETEHYIKETLLKRGAIAEKDMDFYTITDNLDEVIQTIRETPIREWLPFEPIGPGGEEAGEFAMRHCEPCEKDRAPLSAEEAGKHSSKVEGWQLIDNVRIEKTFSFGNFREALHFVNTIGDIAEAEGHHPDVEIFGWNKVRVSLTTHNIGGLSDNDFIMASKIDLL